MAWHGIKTRVLTLLMQSCKLLRASNTADDLLLVLAQAEGISNI